MSSCRTLQNSPLHSLGHRPSSQEEIIFVHCLLDDVLFVNAEAQAATNIVHLTQTTVNISSTINRRDRSSKSFTHCGIIM